MFLDAYNINEFQGTHNTWHRSAAFWSFQTFFISEKLPDSMSWGTKEQGPSWRKKGQVLEGEWRKMSIYVLIILRKTDFIINITFSETLALNS